jgi:molecular chaperone GrpE
MGAALAERMTTENDDDRDRFLRLAADFENFRKRVQQDRLETLKYGAATIVQRLLPVLDDAERALERVPEGTDERWARGLYLVLQHLREVLESTGVRPIEAVGRPFDPNVHEAIGYEETTEHPEGTVIVELRRGYRLHDRVLRPALVKVGRRPPEAMPATEEAAAEEG